MGEMANSNLALDFYIREKRPLIVHFERENAVLIRCFEGRAEDGAIYGLGNWLKVKAVEGREHAKFDLQGV